MGRSSHPVASPVAPRGDVTLSTASCCHGCPPGPRCIPAHGSPRCSLGHMAATRQPDRSERRSGASELRGFALWRLSRLSPLRLRLRRRVSRPPVDGRVIHRDEVVFCCVSWGGANVVTLRMIGDHPRSTRRTITETRGDRWRLLGDLLMQGLSLCDRPLRELLEPEPVVLEDAREEEADKDHQWCQPEHHMPLKTKVLRRARVVGLDTGEARESVGQSDEPDACRPYGNEPQQEPHVSQWRASLVSA